jgi:hypothetical protein
MSDITVINDSEQSSLVTNGLAKNGELYLKAAGSTDAGAIVVYDSGSWRTFANEASAGFANTYSLDFDGSNDYVDVGTISALNSQSNVSMSFWYKTSNTAQVSLVGGTSSNTASAYHWSNGNLYMFSFGTLLAHAITPAPTVGSWHHISLTFNAGTSLMYVDGVYRSTKSVSSTTAYNAGTNYRLAYSNSASYGELLLDEVAIFSSTLSDGGGLSIGDTAGGDIADIYNSGVPTDLTSYSPVHWWRMGDNDGGTGTTITDQGSGGNNGTLTNGPTFSTDVPS